MRCWCLQDLLPRMCGYKIFGTYLEHIPFHLAGSDCLMSMHNMWFVAGHVVGLQRLWKYKVYTNLATGFIFCK